MTPTRTSALRRGRFLLAQVWQVVWGLPQTVVGLVLFLALRGPRRCHAYRAAIVTRWRLRSGLCLGMFIFVPEVCPRSLLAHEYGHTIQSIILGPLFLPVIGLPSILWASLPACRKYRQTKTVSYYRFYPEAWANRLGQPDGRKGKRAEKAKNAETAKKRKMRKTRINVDKLGKRSGGGL